MKVYTSNDVGTKGIIETGYSVEYEYQKNHSCLVLLVGLLLVGAIVTFIILHI